MNPFQNLKSVNPEHEGIVDHRIRVPNFRFLNLRFILEPASGTEKGFSFCGPSCGDGTKGGGRF
jgi:hypothetical protein